MHIDEYLTALPAGLSSYPGAQCKASVVRTFIDGFDRSRLAQVVPDELHPTLYNLPPDSVWIPEVHAQVIFMALREVAFDSDEDYLTMCWARNHALLSSPLYRVIFRLLSRKHIATNMAKAWGRFHRESTLAVGDYDDQTISFRLTYPAGLFCRYIAQALSSAVVVALHVGGLTQSHLVSFDYSASEAESVVRWS